MLKVEDATSADVNWSSHSGNVAATYDELIRTFGPPTYSNEDPDDKVQTEWMLKINGVVATIYNWKTGATPTTGRYHWHVGGFDKGEVNLVEQVLAAWRKGDYNLLS